MRASPTCGVVGLGYVGLNVAVAFDRAGYRIIGYDIDEERVTALERGTDPVGEFGDDVIPRGDATFTTSANAIGDCDYVFVALPTPLSASERPDLDGLESASETVGRHLRDGAVVVYESTLFPGATRDVLRPAVARGAGPGCEFSVGYSPERIAPGRNSRAFSEVTKIVSGEDEETLADLVDLYERVVDAGVYPAASIEVAEAAKCIENAQRDVNIALVNELAMGCHEIGIDPHEVLEAAATKWNFHEYSPGIVGGHCIPVDPHYLRYRFEQSGYDPELIRTARDVNERLRWYVARLTVDALESVRVDVPPPRPVRSDGTLADAVRESNVLLLGFAYKPNVADVRNSPAVGVADELQRLGLDVAGYDPFYDADSAPSGLDFEVQSDLDFTSKDAVVVLTEHDQFLEVDLDAAADEMATDPVLVDTRNAFDGEAVAAGFEYRRL